MKILIAEDFCPKYKLAARVDRGEYESMFGEVEALTDAADYAIVNFECPVTKGGEKPIPKSGPHLRCSARGVEAIRWAGFDCVTLANNHFLDYGDEGAMLTLETCRAAGLDTVGGGRNLATASQTLYKEIAGQRLGIINCCEHEFSIATETGAGSNPLDPVRQYYAIQTARRNADYVIVIVHGGHEHYQLPSTRMQDWYRFFIDAGADAVINHHQHCFSGMEIHRGKPIFYGLGNFLFDTENQDLASTWHDGYMVSLTFSEQGVNFDIHPYRQETAVRLLTEQAEIDAFRKRFAELSQTISSRELLEKCQRAFYAQSARSRLLPFEPYRGRLLRAALWWGWLPSLLRGKSLPHLFNCIQCESHRDIVETALNKIIRQ